jgi:flagellar L-ring protein precursor FlgH
VALLALAACTDLPYMPAPPVPPTYAAAPPPTPVNGGLFRADRYAALVSDNRAHRVGDLLTIRLVERTQARKSASADTKRDSSTDITLPDIPPFNQVPTGALNGGLSQSFKGGGVAAQDNLLSGEVAVTVAQVLPNGVLLVAGEKRLTLNRGEEQVQLTGLVRVDDIGPDNSVPSTRVANAHIRYGGTGEIAEQSRMGWLQRFFAAVSPL